MTSHRRILGVSILGTVVEFYDFTLFAIFVRQIGETFFPSSEPINSSLAALATFGAGFLMRPLGAYLFGRIGDLFGRRIALAISIFLMGIPCLLTGILPGFERIGILAPVAVVGLRMLQGLSAGGEFNGAAIFVLEHFGKNRPGLTGAIVSASGGLGALLAMLASFIVDTYGTSSEAWRYPFILGGAISFIGPYLRRRLEEAPVWQDRRRPNAKNNEPVVEAISKHPMAFATVVAIGSVDSTLAYSLVGFLGVYFRQFLAVSAQDVSILGVIGLCCYLVLCPLMGAAYDRSKEPNQVLARNCLAGIALVATVFAILSNQSAFAWQILAVVLFALNFSLVSGIQHAYLTGLFPPEVRYSGIAVGFNLGSAVVGGMAPFLMTWLVKTTGVLFLPGLYIASLWLVLRFLVGRLVALRTARY